ncbi:hypothetical protein [Phytoactinopolyspora limicola]|uniref:hypothetical protein n=1 Tax=Phytoactinopolyspora limicola TaxID=2715536 RepID=UPI0014083034|nr:hypothetical protein [Phytoactinopolyspora limicola]
MNDTDPIGDALDRLARVADTKPTGDPMPGIRRKARANRRRANALVVAGVAAVAAGIGTWAVVDFSGDTNAPGYANDAPTTGPTPAPSTPTPPPTSPPPTEPPLVEFDRASGDVDGDGVEDVIRVMVPPADADQARESIVTSEDVRLRVDLASGSTAEFEFGEALVPVIVGAPDLNGNGNADMVLSFRGGAVAWEKVFIWVDDTLVQAIPLADSVEHLVDDDGLYTAQEEVSSGLVDERLISWVPTGDADAPYEVRVWTWELVGLVLLATEAAEPQCFRPGQQFPGPC